MGLQVKNISKYFTVGVPVLKGVSFDLAGHEIAAIVGASGCGKTTLLRLIAGFEKADAGFISLGNTTYDKDGFHLKPENRNCGFVFQDLALFPNLTVTENVAFGIKNKNGKKERVKELLDLVELGSLGSRYPNQLSGGQKQRVAIARALGPQPDLLLMDEPFSSLDKALRFQVREEITQILKKAGTSIIIVTHDMEDAYAMADKIIVMDAGKILQMGTPEEIYKTPASFDVARLSGLVNQIEGSFITGDTSNLSVSIIRPEKIAMSSGQGDWKITSKQYQGNFYAYQISNEIGKVLHVHTSSYFEVGTQVSIDVLIN